MADENDLTDTRIISYERILTPNQLHNRIPLTEFGKQTIKQARKVIECILDGKDKRILLIVGPCSIHNINEAKEYASRLHSLAEKVSDIFFIVMRAYMEKPRTSTGWTGMIYDPDLNQTHNMNKGLELAREFLVYAANLGLPCGTEYLDPRLPQYTSDAVAWACIGARTTESQPHRHMASGLSMPVGFKNATNGEIKPAIDALVAASNKHAFFGMDMNGNNVCVKTAGHLYVHIVLRGGKKSPNYNEASINEACQLLSKSGFIPKVMIDCSHDNSGKSPEQQVKVFESVINSISKGAPVFGVMLESYIHEGNQPILGNIKELSKGISVTDPCISWAATERIISAAYEKLKKQ